MQSMGKKKPSWGPSFFKVLLPDYARGLRLPPVFVRNYGEFLQHTSVKLRSNLGETWNVNIVEQINYEDGEKYMWIQGGEWKKFVKDLKLQFGEFIFFVFNVPKSTFDVSVFGTDCCER